MRNDLTDHIKKYASLIEWKFLLLSSVLALGGCEFKVGNGRALWLLWLIVGLVIFYVYAFQKKNKLMQRFAAKNTRLKISQGVSRSRQIFKAGLLIIAMTFGVLALTAIKYGFTWEEVKRRGVDVVIALDVSDSMLVEDAETGGKLSRLERAKREITDLLRMLEGDRIALVAFAGTSFIECPLTLDYAAAEIFLEDISTDLIPVKGTAIGDALRTALQAFAGGSEKSKAIILITDGEDHSGESIAAAEQAKIQNVRIFAIGIGRDEGAPIPNPDGGFRKDRRGEMILSKLDEATLQKIALITGGRYVRSVTGDMDLENIYAQGIKATLEDQELASKRRQRWEERFQWFLAVCIVLLLLEPWVSERTTRRKSMSAIMVGLIAFYGCVGTLYAAPASRVAGGGKTTSTGNRSSAPVVDQNGLPMNLNENLANKEPTEQIDNPYEAYKQGVYDQALQGFVNQQVEHPQNPQILMNIANTHYKMKNYEEAEKTYAQAMMAGDDQLRAEAAYNLGNAAFKQGKLEEAIQYYQNTLALKPNDEDAKFNIEFVRDVIRKMQEQAQKQQQQKQQQNGQCDNPQSKSENNESGSEQKGNQDNSAPDVDQDGLPDELERNAKNPTNPNNPDTDQDGLRDGDEDQNRNGKVDSGETDPNKKDTDGDGINDAQDQIEEPEENVEPSSGQAETAETAEEKMSPEEAQMYLQSLEDKKPTDKRARKRSGRRGRPQKDW